MRGLSVGNFYSCNQIPTFAQVETLQQWDEQIVLAVNGLHTAWLDTAMIVTTQTGFWTPLFLLIIIVLFKKYPAAGAWIVLAGVALTILLSDQVTSGLMKPFFERLRPSHHPALAGQLHLVDGYTGGRFGFASSHAANSFALATVLFFSVRSSLRGIPWLFLWAVFMCFTRLYLGVHYLTDLLAGAAVGLVAGTVGFGAIIFLRNKFGTSVPSNIENHRG